MLSNLLGLNEPVTEVEVLANDSWPEPSVTNICPALPSPVGKVIDPLAIEKPPVPTRIESGLDPISKVDTPFEE